MLRNDNNEEEDQNQNMEVNYINLVEKLSPYDNNELFPSLLHVLDIKIRKSRKLSANINYIEENKINYLVKDIVNQIRESKRLELKP